MRIEMKHFSNLIQRMQTTQQRHRCMHLKALMRKNWIYWKRQYLISILEIILPIVLMGGILATRISIEP